MKNNTPPIEGNEPEAKPETQEMTTLFSSDTTELTDFTRRIEQALRDKQDRRDEQLGQWRNKTTTTPNQQNSSARRKRSSTRYNNVVQLFPNK